MICVPSSRSTYCRAALVFAPPWTAPPIKDFAAAGRAGDVDVRAGVQRHRVGQHMDRAA